MPKKFKPETGFHHLTTTVVGLTAVLGALSIYSLIYLNAPVNQPSRLSTRVAAATTTALPEVLPTARSLTGTIRTFSGSRLMVSTVSPVNGSLRERLVTVRLTPSTTITVVDAGHIDQRRTTVTRRRITPGSFIEVVSSVPIGQASTVVAERVDIIKTDT